jgi:hypothetical protein
MDDPNGDIYKHAGKSVQLSHDGNVLAYGVSTEEVTDAIRARGRGRGRGRGMGRGR